VTDGEKILRGLKVIVTWWDSTGKRTAERVFRPHWPAVAPQDPVATQNPNRSQPGNTGNTGGGGETDKPEEDEE